MITLEQYFGPWWSHPDHKPWISENAHKLLDACASLEKEMVADAVVFPENPITGNGVSGEHNGGFRTQSCPIGALHSAHKEGMAVDRYDPSGSIDAWLIAHPDALDRHGIYIEHPSATFKWSHWSIRAPGSGNHIFYP